MEQTRRGFIGAAAAAGLVVAGCGASERRPLAVAPRRKRTVAPGRHPPGIVERPQAQLQFAAFDVDRDDVNELRDLLVRWSATAAAAMAATPRLTVTFGFGPSLFSG